jgi:group I intron endonuclease
MIIYKATNTINNKAYIGKTIRTLSYRKNSHLRNVKDGQLPCRHFHNAISKYGINNFKWEILAHCDGKENLNFLEKAFIEKYQSNKVGYNLTSGGDGADGHKVSEEAKEKLRKANLGKKQSEETKSKRRISMIGKNTGKRNPEIIEKVKNSIMKNGGYKATSGSFKKGLIPWNKGKKSNIDQWGSKNPSYRNDIDDKKIVELLNDGFSRLVISKLMNCSQRTIDRRILKMRNC